MKIDFPRIPYPKDADYFFGLAFYGKQLRELHLMHNEQDVSDITYESGGSALVEAPKYKDGSIILNKKGSKFYHVPIEIWNMGIGGYQPLQKWLKERKGENLSAADIEHYKQIISILMKTRTIVSEIKL